MLYVKVLNLTIKFLVSETELNVNGRINFEINSPLYWEFLGHWLIKLVKSI